MNIQLPKPAKDIISRLQKHNFECFVVGGYLRDRLLGKDTPTTGIDFATNATPQQILTLFKNAKYENRFGTVILSHTDSFFEITTYRSESGYSDRRHPDKVQWGKTIEEDLQRRDFTINAFAYDGKRFIDLFDGLKDLEQKLIRAVGDPKQRFSEDALRMMRAIRFSSELGFQIELQTLLAIEEKAALLKYISKERIRDEFLKILGSPHPADGVMLLKNTGLLKLFLSELYDAFGVDQVSPKRHHIYDVGTHLINTLKACQNPQPIVRLACLLHDIGKPATRQVQANGVVTFYNHELVGTQMAYKIGQRLRLSKKQLTKLTTLVRHHQFTVSEKQTDKALRRFIRLVGKNNLQDILDLRIADRIGSGAKPSSWRFELFKKRLEEVQKQPFTVHDLAVDGNDIMQLFKISPGPAVGQILSELFQKVESGELQNNRDVLLTYLQTRKI